MLYKSIVLSSRCITCRKRLDRENFSSVTSRQYYTIVASKAHTDEGLYFCLGKIPSRHQVNTHTPTPILPELGLRFVSTEVNHNWFRSVITLTISSHRTTIKCYLAWDQHLSAELAMTLRYNERPQPEQRPPRPVLIVGRGPTGVEWIGTGGYRRLVRCLTANAPWEPVDSQCRSLEHLCRLKPAWRSGSEAWLGLLNHPAYLQQTIGGNAGKDSIPRAAPNRMLILWWETKQPSRNNW